MATAFMPLHRRLAVCPAAPGQRRPASAHDQRLKPPKTRHMRVLAEQNHVARVPPLEDTHADDDRRLATTPASAAAPGPRRCASSTCSTVRQRGSSTHAPAPAEDIRVGGPRRPTPRARIRGAARARSAAPASPADSAVRRCSATSATTTPLIELSELHHVDADVLDEEGGAPGSRSSSTQQAGLRRHAEQRVARELALARGVRPMTIHRTADAAFNDAFGMAARYRASNVRPTARRRSPRNAKRSITGSSSISDSSWTGAIWWQGNDELRERSLLRVRPNAPKRPAPRTELVVRIVRACMAARLMGSPKAALAATTSYAVVARAGSRRDAVTAGLADFPGSSIPGVPARPHVGRQRRVQAPVLAGHQHQHAEASHCLPVHDLSSKSCFRTPGDVVERACPRSVSRHRACPSSQGRRETHLARWHTMRNKPLMAMSPSA